MYTCRAAPFFPCAASANFSNAVRSRGIRPHQAVALVTYIHLPRPTSASATRTHHPNGWRACTRRSVSRGSDPTIRRGPCRRVAAYAPDCEFQLCWFLFSRVFYKASRAVSSLPSWQSARVTWRYSPSLLVGLIASASHAAQLPDHDALNLIVISEGQPPRAGRCRVGPPRPELPSTRERNLVREGASSEAPTPSEGSGGSCSFRGSQPPGNCWPSLCARLQLGVAPRKNPAHAFEADGVFVVGVSRLVLARRGHCDVPRASRAPRALKPVFT